MCRPAGKVSVAYRLKNIVTRWGELELAGELSFVISMATGSWAHGADDEGTSCEAPIEAGSFYL